PGMTPDAATESVAIAGNTAAPSFGGAFDPRRNDFSNIPGDFGGPGGFGDQGVGGQIQGPRGGGFGGPEGGPGGPGGPGGFGGLIGGRGGPPGAGGAEFAAALAAAIGAGGPGGGPGGLAGAFGGGGFPGGGFQLGGQRGRNANPINVNVSYTLSDSTLDAAPYSIRGNAVQKPNYLQNNF